MGADFREVWSCLMASLRLMPGVGTWVNGFFRRMVVRWDPMASFRG